MKQQQRLENIFYVAFWALLFIVPALTTVYHTEIEGLPFRSRELWHIWSQFALMLVVFLLHNFLLAPLLVYRQQRVQYFSFVAILLMVFLMVQCASRPPEMPPIDEPPRMFGDMPPHKPFAFGQHELMGMIMLILMLGMNIGVKLYFRQKGDQQRLAELERENLEQQLEYLKYQINPHFLMNTLNNIHALVDIDPEEAKGSIVELSKILRYMLYEGSHQRVALSREIIFLENYIQLMRKRVADHVSIDFESPEHILDCEIPPLLFITFVENAFKHGVSYQQESFIKIKIETGDQQLRFSCINSKIPRSEDRQGGIGLQNVRRRLDLLHA